MTDMQTLFEQVDSLSPEEFRELYDYIVRYHVQFVPATAVQKPLQKRVLGLHAHLGPHRMSDNFDDELPDAFWLGEE